ncbi:GerAB/ArcD/ProY family transporter [Paenibacillus sinopodophylli]|uniref:GerAB/ArcD/ProY family transporter n=1 Tax=Paenibacillus sinopodophylli TaxID=1837342 RepID=UPI001FE80DBB|nr:endospore germination permease [Paenibacillus sinopodophylli]
MKITGLQIFWMITIMDLGMTLIMTLTPSLQAAKQDIWISILVAGGITLIITWLVTKTVQLYPEQNLIQFCQTILGKWMGKLVIIIYLVQWYTILPIVLRQFTDVIHIMILPSTPKAAVMIIMLALIIYATYSGGIVSIARCSEVLGPIVILMVILTLLASINNVDLKNLLPIFADSGISGIFNGSLPLASYLGHSIEYLMLASFLYKPRKGAPYAYWAVITTTFFTLIAMVMTAATIGPNLASEMWYPFFEMSRKISLFGFIENSDPLMIVIWVASVFIKLTIYLFISSYGTAQLLKVKNWRTLIWFIAPVLLIFAFFPKNVAEAGPHYLTNYWIPFVLPVNMIGLPLLLLVIGKMKQRKKMAIE